MALSYYHLLGPARAFDLERHVMRVLTDKHELLNLDQHVIQEVTDAFVSAGHFETYVEAFREPERTDW